MNTLLLKKFRQMIISTETVSNDSDKTQVVRLNEQEN